MKHCRVVLVALAAVGGALLAAGAWIPAKAEIAQLLLNRAWSASDEGARGVRPWPWADTWPIARLHLPMVAEPLTVLAGASGRNLAFGPTHVAASAAPGSSRGVSVIVGHRDTHFSALRDVRVGDRFDVEDRGGTRQRYVVVDVAVVEASRATLRLDAEDSTIVLVTCYPFDAIEPGGPLRYVVTAERTAQ